MPTERTAREVIEDALCSHSLERGWHVEPCRQAENHESTANALLIGLKEAGYSVVKLEEVGWQRFPRDLKVLPDGEKPRPPSYPEPVYRVSAGEITPQEGE